MLNNFLDRSLWEELKIKMGDDSRGFPYPYRESEEAGAPSPCGCTPSPLSNLLVGNNAENTALISWHSCGAAALAAPWRYRRPGCLSAPGCGKVSAGAGCAFGFVFPPHRPGVGLREHRRAWRLLSTEFCLLPLLYEHISPKKRRGELVHLQSKSILSASILGLCLSYKRLRSGKEPRSAGLSCGVWGCGRGSRAWGRGSG